MLNKVSIVTRVHKLQNPNLYFSPSRTIPNLFTWTCCYFTRLNFELFAQTKSTLDLPRWIRRWQTLPFSKSITFSTCDTTCRPIIIVRPHTDFYSTIPKTNIRSPIILPIWSHSSGFGSPFKQTHLPSSSPIHTAFVLHLILSQTFDGSFFRFEEKTFGKGHFKVHLLPIQLNLSAWSLLNLRIMNMYYSHHRMSNQHKCLCLSNIQWHIDIYAIIEIDYTNLFEKRLPNDLELLHRIWVNFRSCRRCSCTTRQSIPVATFQMNDERSNQVVFHSREIRVFFNYSILSSPRCLISIVQFSWVKMSD